MIRVLVADDHHIVRQGLRHILDREPGMRFAGEAASASEVMARARERNWDVLVLDIGLPDRSGLEVLKEIKEMYPEAPVVILSMHTERQYVRQALSEGASGYVAKEGAAEEVVEAIRMAVDGEVYLSPTLAAGGEKGGGGEGG
jgi:DNA-binding NarL/FixJ family response regulator